MTGPGRESVPAQTGGLELAPIVQVTRPKGLSPAVGFRSAIDGGNDEVAPPLRKAAMGEDPSGFEFPANHGPGRGRDIPGFLPELNDLVLTHLQVLVLTELVPGLDRNSGKPRCHSARRIGPAWEAKYCSVCRGGAHPQWRGEQPSRAMPGQAWRGAGPGSLRSARTAPHQAGKPSAGPIPGASPPNR